MNMRDILSYGQPRQILPRGPVGNVRGNNADNPRPVIGGVVGHRDVEDRTTAYPVNRNAIDQVGGLIANLGTNITGKKAERIGFDCGEPDPANLGPDHQNLITWKEWYKILWKFKVARVKEKQR